MSIVSSYAFHKTSQTHSVLSRCTHCQQAPHRRRGEEAPRRCRQLVDNIRGADEDDVARDVAEQSTIREQHASGVGVDHGSAVGAAVGEDARGDGEPEDGAYSIKEDYRSLTDGASD